MFNSNSEYSQELDLGLLPILECEQPVDQQQCVASIQKRGRPKGQKNSKRKNKEKQANQLAIKKNIGHWNHLQNKKYHWFLEIHHQHFLQKHLRRSDKIFKTMERFLETRQAEQCRSHHQKMQKRYKKFENILQYLRNYFYGSDSQLQLAEELENQQVYYQKLLSRLELNNLINLNSHQDRQNQQDKVEDDLEIQNFYQQQKKVDDLFGENYENGMDFNELLQQ